MSEKEFVDYYEVLQLSPNADSDTIERIFRHLAKKTHPDGTGGVDNDRFQKVVEAHRTLTNPETRAAYDARYQEYWNNKWRLASEAGNASVFGEDRVIREYLLSLLYVQRRRNMRNPGVGELTIARLLQTPSELIDFHLWYLKSKEWVERLQTGQYAITAAGVDEVEQRRLRIMPDHLLEAHLFSDGGANVTAEGDRDLLDSN